MAAAPTLANGPAGSARKKNGKHDALGHATFVMWSKNPICSGSLTSRTLQQRARPASTPSASTAACSTQRRRNHFAARREADWGRSGTATRRPAKRPCAPQQRPRKLRNDVQRTKQARTPGVFMHAGKKQRKNTCRHTHLPTDMYAYTHTHIYIYYVR